MSVGPVDLQAAMKAYTSILEQPSNKPQIAATPEQSIKFQEMVKTNFNKFADMSPQQIVNSINDAKLRQSTTHNTIEDVVKISVHKVADPVKKQEQVIRKALRGEASLQELMHATTDASNAVKTATAVRNKFFEALDKIMSMQL